MDPRYTTDVEGNKLGEFHGDYFTYGAASSEVEIDVWRPDNRRPENQHDMPMPRYAKVLTGDMRILSAESYWASWS